MRPVVAAFALFLSFAFLSAKAAPPERVTDGESSTVGDIQVKILFCVSEGIPIAPPPGVKFTTQTRPCFAVVLAITNTSKGANYIYKPWHPHEPGKNDPVLTDDEGVVYKRVDPKLIKVPASVNVVPALLAAGQTIRETLIFDVPSRTCKHLDLDLPAVNCEAKGTFLLRQGVNGGGKGK